MATKNHKRSMSQPERAFWREAFIHSPYSVVVSLSGAGELQGVVTQKANFADLAVE